MGTEVADTEAAEIKDTAAPEPTAETIEREAEETVEEGSAAVEDEESSASAEDEISEDDEEEKEEEDDPERLSELEILPGKTAYINFYYTIDPEIEGMKDQKVDFSFAYTLEDEEGKQTKNTLRETFRYAVDALNLMTVTAGGEKGYVETGKEDEMLLEFDLGLMREVLEEAIEEELEKTENGDASAAEAKRASASELLVGWEDENGERPLGKKDPAVIKNLKCEVETFGVKLDKFKAIPVKNDDNFGTSLKCSFYVSRKTLPGTYYGRVNASYKIKGKSFHTTQGFKVVVKQETGEMELVGKIGDSEIVMTGPVSSFPKADELSLKVSEVTQEQQEKVDEALQKKAEEEGSEISQYKALDIKLMADGVETEPEGDVQVRFKNVNLEKVDEKKEAEQEKAEEKSIVKKAVRKVMSLFGARSEEEDVAAVAETGMEGEAETKVKDAEDAKAEGSKEAAGEVGDTAESSENIKVLHLDEDAVVANEMKSEVQENGDVVMDTDHFSIYVVVDMGRPGGYINVTVEHWAGVKTIVAKNNDGTPFNGTIDEATVPYTLVGDTAKYNESNGSAVKDDNGTKPFGPYLKDQIYNRYTQTINMECRPTEAIYAPVEDEIIIQNEKQIDKIESLSKISTNIDGTVKNAKDKGYIINQIWITNDKQNIGKTEWSGNYTKYFAESHDNDKNVNGISGESHNYNEETKKDVVTPINADLITIGNSDEKVSAITLKEDSIIRFVYSEIEHEHKDDVYFPVTFYDHNLTDGKAKRNDEGRAEDHNDADGYGLNNEEYFKSATDNSLKGKPKIGVGQLSSGNTNAWADAKDLAVEKLAFTDDNEKNEFKIGLNATNVYLNKGNQKTLNNVDFPVVVPGIVKKELDSNNNLQFIDGIDYNTKFFEETISGYTKEKNEPIYANKKFEYKLGFIRTGDTYTLTSVKKPDETFALQGLEHIKYTGPKYGDKAALFSNGFWPLDDVTYTGKDHLEEGKSDKDETHNWHFGMVFEFDFTVDDYKGPMNFYFRGDDDFWMFVDGKRAIDIGGIHLASGKAIDMKKWLKDNVGLEGTHHVKIYFMERGGAGSCCYMQFTLPNCKPVSFPGVPTTDIAVEKRWNDGNDDLRPDHITVQLLRKEVKVDEDGKITGEVVKEAGKEYEGDYRVLDNTDIDEPEKELGSLSDVWKCSWSALPKVNTNLNEFGQHNKYIYKVREKTVEGYTADYKYINTTTGAEISEDSVGSDDKITCKITNTLNPKVNVKVEKIWHDNDNIGNTRPEKITLQLQYSKDGGTTFSNFIGDKGVLTLDGTPDGEPVQDNEDIQEENQNPEKEQNSEKEYAPEEEEIQNGEQTSSGNQTQEDTFQNDALGEAQEQIPAKEQSQDDGDTQNGNQTSENEQSPRTREYAPWKGVFENLPYYADKVETDANGETVTTRVPVTYRVCEVRQDADGKYTVLTDDGSILPGSNGCNYIVTYKTEKEFPKEGQDSSAVPEDGTTVATTTITNTIAKDMSVTKTWDVPSDLAADLKTLLTAKIGLFKQIKSKNENGMDVQSWQLVKNFKKESSGDKKTQTMTWSASEANLENDYLLISDASSMSWSGEWKNIPQYDSEGNQIIYRIFELDDSNNPIEIPDSGSIIKTINGYTYEVIDGIARSGETAGDGTDESENDKENVVTITNKYLVDLVITKKVKDANSEGKTFNFIAIITKDDKPIILPSPEQNAGYAVDKNGTVSFSLSANTSVIIPVPAGSQVTITEVSHAGYNVSYTANKLDADGKISSSISLDGNGHGVTCTIPIPSDGTASVDVTCTNSPGAILPDTGGPGLLMMSRLGWMLLLLALLMAGMEVQFYGERRNRKAATVQREDSRGFDPDDY